MRLPCPCRLTGARPTWLAGCVKQQQAVGPGGGQKPANSNRKQLQKQPSQPQQKQQQQSGQQNSVKAGMKRAAAEQVDIDGSDGDDFQPPTASKQRRPV